MNMLGCEQCTRMLQFKAGTLHLPYVVQFLYHAYAVSVWYTGVAWYCLHVRVTGLRDMHVRCFSDMDVTGLGDMHVAN